MNIFSKIKFPKAKEKFSIGLDIGTQSIKCVKLKINDAIELVNFDLEDGQLDPTDVLKKIKHVQDADLVNISFCGSSTVIRYVNFLRMNKTELRQALKFEAQKHIPFSLNEVDLDAEILKNDLPENKMLVLIAAIKKELIQQRLKTLENAALRPNIIDIDSIALINAFNFNYPKIDVPENKSICLLNIGASISNINILDNRIPRLSRDIHSAGANFTKKLMDIFELDFKTAEELKINPDPERANKVKAGVENVLTNLAAEIRTSFDYYESQNSSSVVKIFLSGGGSKISGLSEMLTVCLGIPVEPWDAFKQIKISDEIDAQKLNNFSGQFNVAAGLALRQR
ncbi:MAG: type IV pilus assembly protein PilM [Candidatus Omnitrophica bacterium]|nr:type IV pilus assembly protein PilM [Candidatus Omnitrophota bacterium]